MTYLMLSIVSLSSVALSSIALAAWFACDLRYQRRRADECHEQYVHYYDQYVRLVQTLDDAAPVADDYNDGAYGPGND